MGAAATHAEIKQIGDISPDLPQHVGVADGDGLDGSIRQRGATVTRGMLDPALAALLAQQAGNERQHERLRIDAAVQVSFGGFAIDFKVRDISASGIALETHGLMNFGVGDPCVLSLPDHGDIASTVIAVKDDTFHLRFDDQKDARIEAFIKAHTGQP